MKLRLTLSALILLMTITMTGFAQDSSNDQKTDPMSLTVDLGVLMMHSTSTLDTNGEEKISDNTEEGDSPRSVWTLPLFDLRYSFPETRTQLFLGTPIEGSNIALSLGVIQPVPKLGIVTLSVAPSFGMTLWENPYQEDVNREKTPVKMMTTNLKLDKIGFTPFSFYYAHRSVDVENDVIGEINSDLKRDGELHYLELTCDIGLTKTSLVTPGLTHERGVYEGKSNSYINSGVKVSYKQQGQRLMFMIETSADRSRFQKEHPVYQKTREDNRANLFALLRINRLFNVEALHANLIGGGGNVDSSIDFFDSTDTYLATTIGYSF